MKKFLCIVLCLCFLISIVGCKKQTGDAETTGNNDAYIQVPLTLISGGTSDYTIIYPSEAEGVDAEMTAEVYKLFLDTADIKLDRKDDFIKDGETRTEGNCKILIGKTNYSLSDIAYTDLMYQEFRIITDETNLAIAAYTASGYNAAIEWLKANVFSKYSNGELIMDPADVKDSLVTGYSISKWTIGGNELKNYKIVYAEGIEREKMIAFRDAVATKTGWHLDVLQDTESTSSEYEILIGDTNREESKLVVAPSALNYSLKTVGKKLVVKTGGEHSFELLIEDFFDVVAQDAEKVSMGESYELLGDYYDDPYNTAMAKDADIRIFTCNTQVNGGGYSSNIDPDFKFDRRLEIFFAALDFYQPTVVGLQEFCTSWLNGMQKYEHIDKWDVLEFENPRPEINNQHVFSTIMYRKDLLTLIDSGTLPYSQHSNGRCRFITWAVLKVNSTGKEFCFVSTHWDGGGDNNTDMPNTLVQVEEISTFVNKMKEKYPVFTTGDFNRNEYTPSFKQYLVNIDSVDCMYAAKERLNVAGSYHNWGTDVSSIGSCDHITATKDTTVLKFETLMYNQQIYGSDHAWLMADIKFN